MSDDYTGVEYCFDAKYAVRTKDSDAAVHRLKYRIVIGSTNGGINFEDTVFDRDLDIMSPGPTLEFQGDEARALKAVMGSTLSMTFRCKDATQIAAWERISELEEETVFCLFFTSWSATAQPYWFGHIVMDQLAMEIRDGYRYVDVTFTDGLAQLRNYKWAKADGSNYTGFNNLRYYLYEIIKKLPAFPAYVDYFFNYGGSNPTNMPVMAEVGFPDPKVGDFNYDHLDSKLFYIKVRYETFVKPKKQVDRIWELPYPREYFNAGDVLEDICKTFGATAAIFQGQLNMVCKLDLATLGGEDVITMRHYVDSSGDFTITTNSSTDYLLDDFDDEYVIRDGATQRRTRAVSEVKLVHEEGGSDWMVAGGYYLDETIGHIDLSDAFTFQYLLQGSGQYNSFVQLGDFTFDGHRADLWYQFWEPGDLPDYPITQTGSDVNLPFYKFPVVPSDYMGFPAHTTDNLEVQSGEPFRVQLGVNAQWKKHGIGNNAHLCIGSTLVVRARIQFTTTSGVQYRLRRVVKTHVLSPGYDGINIDMTAVNDRKYYRKFYDDVEWVKTGDANFADGWFEVMVPHEDTNNSGEGYGATVIPLAINYADQVNYAPIGVKIQGEVGNNGATIFEPGDPNHFFHYMSLDRSFDLPYDGETTLDFESFYFEMGVAQWLANYGPRPVNNPTAPEPNVTNGWAGQGALFRSANADGTGGSYFSIFGGGSGNEFLEGLIQDGYHKALPQHIQMAGLRVVIGDGSESKDFTTKISGGDGYELINLGSSRLGSRVAFSNTHVGGTLFARKKNSDQQGFVLSDTYENHSENLQWRGHRAGDTLNSGNVNLIPTSYYDSLHSYVCYAFLDMFGETRKMYDMSLMTIGNEGWGNQLHPFKIVKTKQTVRDKSTTEYLMPISWKWTADIGVEGTWIVTKFERERSDVIWWGGDPDGGLGGGNGSGLGKGDLYGPVGSGIVSSNDKWPRPWGTVFDLVNHHGKLTANITLANTGDLIEKWESVQYDDGGTAVTWNFSDKATDVAASKTKTDLLTITASTDLDTMRSDVATNNGKVGISTADQTKLDYLTVNANVDLDFVTFLDGKITIQGGNITAINLANSAITAEAIETDADRRFVSDAQRTQIGTNQSSITSIQTKTDAFTVNQSGEIDSLSIEDGVIEPDAIEVTPAKTFVTAQQQSQISTNATNVTNAVNTANAADTKATAAQTVTNLIQTDSEGITGFTIGDGTTVLSTDFISEDADRTFVNANEQTKLDKIQYTNDAQFTFNLDTEKSRISNSKVITDRFTTTGAGPQTKITGITTTNGTMDVDNARKLDEAVTFDGNFVSTIATGSGESFDVDDGRVKMGFMNADATGITLITVSNSVELDMLDSGAFFAGGSGGTASRGGGVSGDRVLLIDENGGMDEVADGNDGDFLKTNGSGGYSFAKVPGQGYHGSETRIKIGPSEFMGNDVGRAIVSTFVEDDTTNQLGLRCNQSSAELFAFVSIPSGYKATHCHAYTSSAVTNGLKVHEYNTTTGALTNTTTGDTNTNVDITDITSSTTNMLVVAIKPGSTTNDVFSAHVTIAKT